MKVLSLNAIPAILAAALLSAACSTPPKAPPQTPARPSTAPMQPAALDPHRSDGTTFDPCTAFAPEDLTKWGLEANPLARAGTPADPARGCQWNAPPCASHVGTCWSLNVLVANQTVADYIRVQGARAQTVAGRAGAISTDGPDTCYLTVPAQKASVSVGITSDDTRTIDPCGKASAIAPDVVKYLPPPA